MAWFNPNITFTEESEQFIGRHSLIAALEKELSNISPQPRLCYSGLLRSGKTSVFTSVYNRIRNKFICGDIFVMPMRMDLMHVPANRLLQMMIKKTTDDTHRKMLNGKVALEEIDRMQKAFLEKADNSLDEDIFDLVESWIDWWTEHNIKLLYILDEFQCFHEIVDSELILDILSKQQIGIVLVGRTTLKTELSLLHNEIDQKIQTCCNFTQRAFLGFDDDDMQLYWKYLCQHLDYSPSYSMRDQIISFAGQSPLLLSFFGQHIEMLLEYKELDKLNQASVKDWEICAYNDYYNYCRIQLRCDELLEGITKVICGSKIPRGQIELLHAMGYLYPDTDYSHDKAGWYAITKEFTRRLQEDPTINIDIKIHYAERLLGRMIIAEYENIFPPLKAVKNKNEWNETIKKLPIASSFWKGPVVIDNVLYSGSHKDAWTRHKAQRVDSCFTLFTRFCIIVSYFDSVFHKYFTDEKTDVWINRFHKIYSLRNDLDHPSPYLVKLTAKEKEKFTSAAYNTKMVIDCLKEQFTWEGDIVNV